MIFLIQSVLSYLFRLHFPILLLREFIHYHYLSFILLIDLSLSCQIDVLRQIARVTITLVIHISPFPSCLTSQKKLESNGSTHFVVKNLKHVFVCIHHFHDNDVERTYKILIPDGFLSEIPRGQPKLKKRAIPSLIPGCAPYYSESSSKPTRLSFDDKEDIQFQKVIILAANLSKSKS